MTSNSTSITSLLEQSLDLIGDEINKQQSGGSSNKTAARSLIEERKKTKTVTMENSFVFQPRTKPSATGGTPLLEQISGSSVAAPKYWSGASKSKAEKASTSSKKTSGGKVKGEDYNNRFQEKLAAKAAKAKRKSQLKSK